MAEFVDFCILCGCDYCPSIKGVGPITAYKFIKSFKNIETIVMNLEADKFQLPDHFPFKEARALFNNPKVHPVEALPPLSFGAPPDLEGLREFLCDHHSFGRERVEKYIARLKAVAATSVGAASSSRPKRKRERSAAAAEGTEEPVASRDGERDDLVVQARGLAEAALRDDGRPLESRVLRMEEAAERMGKAARKVELTGTRIR
eukprot:GHVU01148060.1.p1 GENE.GHVU01148060.1~~GHVU01148060.1.p1  ORF type:complete len:204 (+),score=40.17 GHVU01148060.1:144-755(+)